MSIRQVFRVNVGYDHPEDNDVVEDAITPFMMNLGRDANSSIFTGNPACYPYIEAEFSTSHEAENWEAKVKSAIKSVGGVIDP